MLGGGINSCTDEQPLETHENNRKSGGIPSGNVLLSISYNIETNIDYVIPDEKMPKIEAAYLNPLNNKQSVYMELMDDGTINMDIEKVDFDNKISIPHKILPDDMPQITHTKIRGNIISFYDKEKRFMQSTNIELPDMKKTVDQIKSIGNEYSQDEINKTIAYMQGHPYLEKLDEYIANASTEKGVTIIEQGDTYVTIRVDMMAVDSKSEHDIVLLVDKVRNKMVGQRIYGTNDELLQTSYYGYNNGKQQFLNAIKTEQFITLPSGKKVQMVTNSYIDNFDLSINL